MNTDTENSSQTVASRPLWSATPTPFDTHRELDLQSLERVLVFHISQNVDGVFLAGTCGEGPWMTDRQREQLLASAREIVGPDYPLAFQVTDNSAARTINQIEVAARNGANIAVVAQPALTMNGNASRSLSYYQQILDQSPLDICFYNRGNTAAFPLPPAVVEEICLHPRVTMVKDSSMDAEHHAAALLARSQRPGLTLMSGNEFGCLDALIAGVDGLMLGGAVLSAPFIRALMEQFDAGDLDEARRIENESINLLHAVYGGEGYPCWLSGLKHALCALGIFKTTSSYLEYPLTPECRKTAEAAMRKLTERKAVAL